MTLRRSNAAGRGHRFSGNHAGGAVVMHTSHTVFYWLDKTQLLWRGVQNVIVQLHKPDPVLIATFLSGGNYGGNSWRRRYETLRQRLPKLFSHGLSGYAALTRPTISSSGSSNQHFFRRFLTVNTRCLHARYAVTGSIGRGNFWGNGVL